METIPTLSTTDAQNLEKILINLNNVFRKHRHYIKEKYGITALEMELIQFVVQNGPQKMKAVADHFHIKLSTLTSIIDKAEKARILKRTNSKEDRRVVFLDTTKKGREVFESYQNFLKETASRIHQDMDETTFQHFVKGIETFTQLTLT